MFNNTNQQNISIENTQYPYHESTHETICDIEGTTSNLVTPTITYTKQIVTLGDSETISPSRLWVAKFIPKPI